MIQRKTYTSLAKVFSEGETDKSLKVAISWLLIIIFLLYVHGN